MYQNNLINGTGSPGLYNAGGYIYAPPYGGYAPKEQSQNPTPIYTSQPNPSGLKGRPVSSFEEARAATIDFDGSIYIFTDIGNKKIYTKQINVDGTATLNTYSLVEDNPKAEEPKESTQPEYVTREEFNQVLSQIQAQLTTKAQEDKKSATLNNF